MVNNHLFIILKPQFLIIFLVGVDTKYCYFLS